MLCVHCQMNLHEECEGGDCDCIKCLLERQGTDEQEAARAHEASKLTPDQAKSRLIEILSPLVPELVTLVAAMMQDKRPETMPLNALCVRGSRLIELMQKAQGTESEFAQYLEPQNRYLLTWERLESLIASAQQGSNDPKN